MKKKIAIIDYGLGNIQSAKQSFLKVSKDNNFSSEVYITNNPLDLEYATHIVLPGQGAFKTCIDNLLNIKGMVSKLKEKVVDNKLPFLGICIGMQLLASVSYENGKHNGLGWIKGEIKKIPNGNLKLPHMGWNDVKILKNNKVLEQKKTQDYYFVHSFYFECLHKDNSIGITNYGIDFTSFVSQENIYGVQFHPEKSSTQGLNLIKNFLLL